MIKENDLIQAVERLSENADFWTVVSHYTIDSMLSTVDDFNLNSSDTIDELKARKLFKFYIYDIIDKINKEKEK